MNDLKLTEKKISSKQVFDGVLLKVFSDKVQLENGNITDREMIVHNGAVCVVAIDDENNTYLVKQYRYPFSRVIREIPAGKIDKGENPLIAAHRELEEEIGMKAKEMIYIGEFYPTVAYSTEIIYMYIAKGLEKTIQNLDEDEFINVEILPFKKLVQEIMDGKIGDGKTIAAVLKTNQIGL